MVNFRLLHRVDVDFVFYRVDARTGSVGGLLQVELLVGVHRFFVHPNEHSLEVAVFCREVVGFHDHFSAGDVDFVLKSYCHAQRRKSLFDFAFVGDDALHFRHLAGRQSHHGVALADYAGSHLAAESAEVEVWSQHVLHRVAEIVIVAVEVDGHSLKIVEHAFSCIPRSALAFLNHVVAVERRQRYACHVGDAERRHKLLEVAHDFVKHRFVEVNQVHLVDSKYKVLDAEQRNQISVSAGDYTSAGVDKDYCRVGRRSAGNHVACVLLMSRGVGDDEFTVVCAEVAVSHVDGDSLLALSLQSVEQQGIIDMLSGISYTFAVALEGVELVFVDFLAVEEQSADERRFSIIDAAGG